MIDNLPKPLALYISAENGGDMNLCDECFTDEAIVREENYTHTAWTARAIGALRCSVRAAKFWRTACRGSFDAWPKACLTWKICRNERTSWPILSYQQRSTTRSTTRRLWRSATRMAPISPRACYCFA